VNGAGRTTLLTDYYVGVVGALCLSENLPKTLSEGVLERWTLINEDAKRHTLNSDYDEEVDRNQASFKGGTPYRLEASVVCFIFL